MLLSTQTERLAERFGYKKAIEILADAGYDAYDLSQFHPNGEAPDPLYTDDFREYAKELRVFADARGIRCNQSHAPFPSSKGDPATDEEIYKSIVRAMEIAGILGAKCIVVHPKQHLPYRENAAALRGMNLEFYRSLIPYAARFGVRIAVENMWQWNPVGRSTIVNSVCARAEEFCDYIDTLDSEWIVACLDLGHISLVGEDVGVMIRALGPRLQALHVHDTDGYRDLHTLPFTAKNDYPMIMRALREIGYPGDLTFEADNFYANFPVDMSADVARFMQLTGRRLIRMFEEAES